MPRAAPPGMGGEPPPILRSWYRRPLGSTTSWASDTSLVLASSEATSSRVLICRGAGTHAGSLAAVHWAALPQGLVSGPPALAVPCSAAGWAASGSADGLRPWPCEGRWLPAMVRGGCCRSTSAAGSRHAGTQGQRVQQERRPVAASARHRCCARPRIVLVPSAACRCPSPARRSRPQPGIPPRRGRLPAQTAASAAWPSSPWSRPPAASSGCQPRPPAPHRARWCCPHLRLPRRPAAPAVPLAQPPAAPPSAPAAAPMPGRPNGQLHQQGCSQSSIQKHSDNANRKRGQLGQRLLAPQAGGEVRAPPQLPRPAAFASPSSNRAGYLTSNCPSRHPRDRHKGPGSPQAEGRGERSAQGR